MDQTPKNHRELVVRAIRAYRLIGHAVEEVTPFDEARTDLKVRSDEGLDSGVYHYDPKGSRLIQLREGDYQARLAEAAGGNRTVLDAPVTVGYTDVYWRNAIKYLARAYWHSFWDAGTVLANTLAMAASLHIATRLIMGFADEAVDRLLGIDPGEELPLALVPLGWGTRHR